MLIDSSHKKWIWTTAGLAVAAAAIWGWEWYRAPAALTGGSTLGLWYGILGSLLMIFAGLLSALRKVPTWSWLGPRKVWLRGHIWLGLLAVVLILLHSGFRLGGTLEKSLWAVIILITLSGIFGLLLQQFVPRILTLRIPCESPTEQIPHLCLRMRQTGDQLVDSMANGKANSAAVLELSRFYDEMVRPFLGEDYTSASPLAAQFQAESVFTRVRAMPGMKEIDPVLRELESLCTERRFLGEQQRLHRLLHSWLLVHVPLSAALLVLGVAHVILSLYF